MEEIEQIIKNCNKCGDLQKPACNSFQIGKSTILVIGESPAKDGWLKSGKAFYNEQGKLQATGKILDKLLNLCNMTIKDISFTECCKCHINDRTQLDKCSENCKEYLLRQIKYSDCKIILTMGLYPTQILLNQKIKKFANIVGNKYKFLNKIVIPIYHCSPINPLSYKGNEQIFKNLSDILN